MAEDSPIYLDHAATTPVDPEVLQAMLPFFSERFGNPSSIYTVGRDARAGLDHARAELAAVLNAHPRELVLTSGATESNNLAIRGVAWQRKRQGSERRHVVASAIEHPSVLHCLQALELDGFGTTLVPPGSDGIIDPDAIRQAIRDDTCLVSVMYANNEIGTIQPIAAIADVVHQGGALLHCDAVQAAGALNLDIERLGVDLLTLTAHKFYGPKGVGLLYVRRGTALAWQQQGGGQENARRGGTENVAGIVGMATALGLAERRRAHYVEHCSMLRERLFEGILERVPDAFVNGDRVERLPNNVNLSFPNVEGETILLGLDILGIAASSGSACSTGSTEPSHVLRALGLDDGMARGSLRLTVGLDNTVEEIDRAIEAVVETIARVRELAEMSA